MTNNNDNHILDYIQFHTEQMEWFDQLEQRHIIEQDIAMQALLETIGTNYHE